MLQFTELVIENFGPFKGKQNIDLSDANGVTIIWGNNGRGKTTLLNIIRYVLFGTYQNRRGMDVDLPSLANIEAKQDGVYEFKVTLKMLNDGIDYELTRQYSPIKSVKIPQKNDDYVEDVFLKKQGTFLSADQREHELNLIMPSEVSRFFLFDGELLEEYEELLLEDTKNGASIKESIEQILGVPVLTNGASDTESVLEEQRKEKNKIAQSNAQTEKIATQMTTLETELQEHLDEQSRLQDELDAEYSIKAGLEDEAKHSERISSLVKDLENLEAAIAEKQATKEGLLSQIVVATDDAWRGLVSTQVDTIIKSIDTKLEELENKDNSYRVASQFMDDMKQAAENHHCHICNQDISAEKLEALMAKITAASGTYSGLSTEEKQELQELRVRKGNLNSLKGESKKAILEVLEKQLAGVEVEIGDSLRQKKAIRDDLESYGDVETLSRDTRENVKNLANSMKKIENFKEGIAKEKEKIDDIKSALASLEEKLNKASTDAETQKAVHKVELCDAIHQIFEAGITAYRDKLKKDVERDATELFVQISNDPDYTSLEINDNYGLEMVHRSGRKVPLRSAGFEHVVALALIGALHKNAPLRGPIIMDSPFGRLDPTHKNNITKALPKMSEQIVLLAYTKEIDEQNARKTLGGSLKREYRLTRVTSFNTQIEML